MKTFAIGAIGAGLLSAASAVQAATLLEMDLNDIVVSRGSETAFSTSFTGTLTLSKDSDAAIVDIRKGNPGFTPSLIASLTSNLSDLNGEIELTNGVVSGGFINIALSNGDAYSANITGGSAVFNSVAGQFLVAANTDDGTFTDVGADGLFGGVNIDEFVGNLNGTHEGGLFQFGYNGNAIDDEVSLEAEVVSLEDEQGPVIPLPASAVVGGAMLAGMGALRMLRRRA